jgi:CrcB protein
MVTGRVRRMPPFAGTFIVNVLGSLILGLLYGSGEMVAVVVGAGFLGGFTTFSAASVETALLARDPRRGRAGRAIVNALAMVCACVAAGALGLVLT